MTEFRVDPQLQSGSPTAGDDCAFQQARGAIRALSDGALLLSIHQLRVTAGVPTGGTDMPTVRDLVNHYVPGAARFSRTLDDLWAALAGGPSFLGIGAINHRVLNSTWPEISGDLGFNGTDQKPALHAQGWQGWERVISQGTKGPYWTRLLDALHDGRVRSVAGNPHRYPKQIVQVRQTQIATLTQAVPSGVQLVICKHP